MRTYLQRLLLSLALLVPGLCLSTEPAPAQQPLPVGTATAWGMGAMTEARFAEAALWNPALLSIFDGPLKSFSVLNTVVEPGNLDAATELHGFFRSPGSGPVDEDLPSVLADQTQGDGPSRYTGFGGVQWLGLHVKDLAISANSYVYWRQQVPGRAAAILGGDETAITDPIRDEDLAAAASLPSRYTTASVFTLSKGTGRQDLGPLGPGWFGFTAKGGLIHDHAEGRFLYATAEELATEPDGDLRLDGLDPAPEDVGARYIELGVEDTKMAGLDVGAAANPIPPVLLSVTAANVVQTTWMDENTLYISQIDVVGPDDAGQMRAFATQRDLDLEDRDAARAQQADDLLQDTHFLRVVRAGGSVDTRWGRLAGGVSIPLEDEGIDRDFHDRFSIGFHPFLDFAPRVSVSRGIDGSTAVRAGLQHGFCSTRVAMGVGYRTGGTRASSLEATLSLSFGRPPCGLY